MKHASLCTDMFQKLDEVKRDERVDRVVTKHLKNLFTACSMDSLTSFNESQRSRLSKLMHFPFYSCYRHLLFEFCSKLTHVVSKLWLDSKNAVVPETGRYISIFP